MGNTREEKDTTSNKKMTNGKLTGKGKHTVEVGNHPHTNMISKPSIIALFTIARTWKKPKCLSTDEWIRKLWYVCVCVYIYIYIYIHKYIHTHTYTHAQ